MDISLFGSFMRSAFESLNIKKEEVHLGICEDDCLAAVVKNKKHQFFIKETVDGFTMNVSEYLLAFAGIYTAKRIHKHTAEDFNQLNDQIKTYFINKGV